MKNRRMPLCTIVPSCMVICSLFCVSELCSPVPQMDAKILALRRALQAAEQTSVEGRIVFSLDGAPMPFAGPAPTCKGPAQPLTLIRTRLGRTAVFGCPLRNCPCHNTTCPDFDALLWHHKGHLVREVPGEGDPSSFVYRQTRTSTTAYMHIHNVTFNAVGSVYCHCLWRNDTGRECVNQAYRLTPLLTPADVFQSPVMNVTHRAGTNITLFSKLRIRMTEHTSHRYIVRYNRRIIFAQTSHPLRALRVAVFPDGGDLELNEDNFSMTMPNLPKFFSGQFEVWVRPYMEEDEFVVQTINLKLT